MSINTIGVVGAGQMGAGIAQVAASVGLNVICSDINQDACDRGHAAIAKSLGRLVKKERMSQEDADAALARVRFSTDLAAMSEADFVVEAATENEGLKAKIFGDLDRICAPGVILATNTSSISITRIGAATNRPEQVVGMHFMNPVPIMKLVELISGIATSETTAATTQALAERLGKTVSHSKDYPGFVVNRILMPMINEAFYALYEGIGSAEDIDTGMKLGTNQPMGPLTLADFIGLDTCLAIMRVLHEGLGDAKYRPCPLLIQYVDAGWFGRKSGRGVYDYSEA
ncbi:MAG: 3-hydroxybutyryl-CoA dehydrogenase [Myxococcota bacterium]|nr:3-hydroxybutyryl-CoA dehydrogenase [Myxococcota bacterium]